eukprot:TRINITY_DN28935_c0_g1_i1.p1 TRINITY_DN28935_c0_g1~~TRINITY_DN28935_c0_g1_i1.p1  ORF type:complete len:246 (-),score=54.71 TRINITY_DN28935_c0_g1_i1:241-909(-)
MQPSRAELLLSMEPQARILYELEHPETIDSMKPPIPTREKLRMAEAKKMAAWMQAPRRVSRSKSSPSGLSEMAQEVTQKFVPKPLGTQLELHRRGFGVSKRPEITAQLGVSKDSVTGPGQYDTHDVGAFTWDRKEISNPAQKALSQHKTPTRVSFGKIKEPGLKKAKIAQMPGPGYYDPPNLWDPKWQKYPGLGCSIGPQPAKNTESKFGQLASSVGPTLST